MCGHWNKAFRCFATGKCSKQDVSLIRSLVSCCALGKRWTALQQEDQDAGLSFDKDDEDTMDFVAACTNLRAHVFSIEVLSRFQIKGDSRSG